MLSFYPRSRRTGVRVAAEESLMLKFFRRSASPTEALNRRPAIEPLEQRRLLSITHWTVSPLSTTNVGDGITPPLGLEPLLRTRSECDLSAAEHGGRSRQHIQAELRRGGSSGPWVVGRLPP